MAATLYRGGRVYSPADPHATALLTDDDRIVWVGADDDCPRTPDETVELAGALVTPAFVDAHAHVTDTGLALVALDLTAVRSAGELLDAVSAYAAGLPAGALIFGQGWDESTWPDPAKPTLPQLERAAGGRPAFLSQISGHSALCTGALTALVPDLAQVPGYDPGGWHTIDAQDVLRAAALGALDDTTRHAAQHAALARAAALGIACLHECGGPATSSETDFTELLALDGSYPEIVGYWGEVGAAAKVREWGAAGAAGDLYADGALGSQDAHLTEPYADAGGCGHAYLSAEQVAAHIVDCTSHGVQGGMHAIGDAAIGTVLAGFAAAAEVLGIDRIRDARHRVEHVEILDKRLIAGLVEYGLTASVQPAFDRLWGGAGQMYQTRLGLERSLASNPFGSLAGVGVPLAFGSDSPVTPLDPWGTVRAAVAHHNPAQRLTVRTAFAAHTRGGWRAARRDDAGLLAPGAPATLAVFDVADRLVGGLPELADDAPLPRCVRTVRDGVTIFRDDT
ncbi:amidohydrolase [Actinocatenispora rupis]|uniref:Amidohydrolase n=1 Tax=Actinocatenispora rupis TaxID=519421 RepID=A0A8J3NB25_9ACTN|nr:amidohydrolase family protein [Actinocatenispora rupis]GID12666.1 amidohydrolase [Actinocatenispora rupis]